MNFFCLAWEIGENPAYSPTNGIGNVESGRVNSQSNIKLFDAPLGGAIIGELAPGETITVVDPSPACWQMPSASNNQIEYRLWHVRTDQLNGWVSEYSRSLLGVFYNIEPLDAANASSTTGCFTPPYEPDQGIRIGTRVRVTENIPENGARILAVNMRLTDRSVLDALKPGHVLRIVGGPVCRRELTFTNIVPIREWRVRSEPGDLEAWVHEYDISGSGVIYQLIPAS